jgi:flagellin-like protein
VRLTDLFGEERAVSPVIAVVLMIAVTVILASVAAALAFSLGGSAQGTPRVNFGFDWDDAGTDGGDDDTLVITHEGGDSVRADRVNVLIDGVEDTTGSWEADPLVTGTSYTIDESAVGSDVVNGGDEVRVVWTGEDGQGTTLGVYEIPA